MGRQIQKYLGISLQTCFRKLGSSYSRYALTFLFGMLLNASLTDVGLSFVDGPHISVLLAETAASKSVESTGGTGAKDKSKRTSRPTVPHSSSPSPSLSPTTTPSPVSALPAGSIVTPVIAGGISGIVSALMVVALLPLYKNRTERSPKESGEFSELAEGDDMTGRDPSFRVEGKKQNQAISSVEWSSQNIRLQSQSQLRSLIREELEALERKFVEKENRENQSRLSVWNEEFFKLKHQTDEGTQKTIQQKILQIEEDLESRIKELKDSLPELIYRIVQKILPQVITPAIQGCLPQLVQQSVQEFLSSLDNSAFKTTTPTDSTDAYTQPSEEAEWKEKRIEPVEITPPDDSYKLIIDTYNRDPNILESEAIKAAESRESFSRRYQDSCQPAILENKDKGNWWIVPGGAIHWLLPKAGLKVNYHLYEDTFSLLFNCEGYMEGGSNQIDLICPAVVESYADRQWQLKHPGKVIFRE